MVYLLLFIDTERIRRDIDSLRNEYRMQSYIQKKDIDDFKKTTQQQGEEFKDSFSSIKKTSSSHLGELQHVIEHKISTVKQETMLEIKKLSDILDKKVDNLNAKLMDQRKFLENFGKQIQKMFNEASLKTREPFQIPQMPSPPVPAQISKKNEVDSAKPEPMEKKRKVSELLERPLHLSTEQFTQADDADDSQAKKPGKPRKDSAYGWKTTIESTTEIGTGIGAKSYRKISTTIPVIKAESQL